jgi:hypothetical protein
MMHPACKAGLSGRVPVSGRFKLIFFVVTEGKGITVPPT